MDLFYVSWNNFQTKVGHSRSTDPMFGPGPLEIDKCSIKYISFGRHLDGPDGPIDGIFDQIPVNALLPYGFHYPLKGI